MTMENNQEARKHRSESIARLRRNTPPQVKLAVRAKMILAARIADLMEAKGWTKSEFARKVDQEPSVITKWLSGTHNFTQDTLADIAAVFGLNAVEELYALNQSNKEVANIVMKEDDKHESGAAA